MTKQEFKSIVGRNVQIRRKQKCWTQENLAEKINVSKNTISVIEAGKNFTHAETLLKLASALETEVYELLKPENILPDNVADVILKYNEELIDAMNGIKNGFLGNG